MPFLLLQNESLITLFTRLISQSLSLINRNLSRILHITAACCFMIFFPRCNDPNHPLGFNLRHRVIRLFRHFTASNETKKQNEHQKHRQNTFPEFSHFAPTKNKKCAPLRDARKTHLSMLRHIFHKIRERESTFLPIVLPYQWNYSDVSHNYYTILFRFCQSKHFIFLKIKFSLRNSKKIPLPPFSNRKIFVIIKVVRYMERGMRKIWQRKHRNTTTRASAR